MKRGSALLIVLGMVAFMVISAVAFSAYMRASRLPSSYLRRTSASRQLVKAALAEAIEQIDIAIGNDPYPGLGNDGQSYCSPRVATATERAVSAKRNYWRSHCFIGTNNLVSADETVSPLCLEALAYVPPALINEVRYYSRHSVAARWQALGFDAGRYAFAAVDVSDHFDVNRIAANVGRNSSDNGRVSLSHLFENQGHTSWDLQPSAWDAFMDEFVDASDAYKDGRAGLTRNPSGASGSKVPLVSLADYGLAAADHFGSSSTTVPNPFCRYVESAAAFVTSATSTEADRLRTMAFVTDSYFPKTETTVSDYDFDYDLADPQYQPFDPAQLRSSSLPTIMSAFQSTLGLTRLLDSICGVGLAALWDLLDVDNVPISLAIPTTERVPMVCGIQPGLASASLTVKKTSTETSDYKGVPEDEAVTRETTRVDDYKIDPGELTACIQGGQLRALLVYPFRRDEALLDDTFTVGGRVSIFLAPSALTLRTGNADDLLHYGSMPGASDAPSVDNNSVINVPLQERQVNLKSDVKEWQDAVPEPVTFTLSHGATKIATWFDQNSMYKISRKWTQTRQKDPDTGKPTGDWLPKDPDEAAASAEYVSPTECYFRPLTASGAVDTRYATPGNFQSLVKDDGGETVSVQMCVWLYVKNGDGKVVDLVPACMMDDKNLNGVNNYSSFSEAPFFGKPYPILRFTGNSFDYKPKSLTLVQQPLALNLPSDALFCADPRWNWAPEHWFKPGGTVDATTWYANCQVGKGGRDRDIFMATSDAGYLQSVYELAFLPQLTDMQSTGASSRTGDMENPETGLADFADNFEATPNSGFAWKTYRPFEINGSRHDFEGLGFTTVGSGFRVNPFSSSDDILMAAFANTPHNWAVASTNMTGSTAVQESERKAEDFNKKYCFNMMASDANSKFEWTDLKAIATAFRTAVRGRTDGDWKAAFDGLDWAGDSFANGDRWAGVTLSGSTAELTDVDKKFLYGYWRECFAARQQLFLVFVRAEPAMMGGGSARATPPQLGARAVALVWRDPTKTAADVSGQPRPHRTRVLFYRQFD